MCDCRDQEQLKGELDSNWLQ